jgi:hypothetical protein
MLRILSICLIITAFICFSSFASENKYPAGFLQELAPAENLGMGGGITAYSIGARALNNNPAGLALEKGNEFFIGSYRTPNLEAIIMKQNQNEDWEDFGSYGVKRTEMEYINYSLPKSKLGNLGLSLAFNHLGRFIRVNEEGKAVNAFPQDDIAIGAGYGLELGKGLAVGFDAKSMRSKTPGDKGDKITRAYAMNVGLMHQISDRVRVGAVWQDIGKELSVKSPDKPRKIRQNFILGAMYNIKNIKKTKINVSADLNLPFEDGLRYNVGTELIYAQRLTLRIGYMRDTQEYYDSFYNISENSYTNPERQWVREGLTFGAGVKFKNAEINIARTPYREPNLKDGEKLRLENKESITSLSLIVRF